MPIRSHFTLRRFISMTLISISLDVKLLVETSFAGTPSFIYISEDLPHVDFYLLLGVAYSHQREIDSLGEFRLFSSLLLLQYRFFRN